MITKNKIIMKNWINCLLNNIIFNKNIDKQLIDLESLSKDNPFVYFIEIELIKNSKFDVSAGYINNSMRNSIIYKEKDSSNIQSRDFIFIH